MHEIYTKEIDSLRY